ncbi:MAG TPA: hypothetical protein VHD36_04220 [Pirellulales bacterium]|nr:hypothetical protein [Pirellulales bacterium]
MKRQTLCAATTWCAMALLLSACVHAAGSRSRTMADTDERGVFISLEGAGVNFVEEDKDADAASSILGTPPTDETATDGGPRVPANCEDDTDADAVAPADAPSPDGPLSTAIEQPQSETMRRHIVRLTPRMSMLRERIRETLGYYHNKRLNTRDHNPWEVMHSIVAYGAASNLNRNGPDGPMVNAISWLCWNGECKGNRILEVADGKLAARKGPQVQGHPGQFLAILAQWDIATNCPIKVGKQQFTLEDLIESEKLGCQPGMELTFKLIGLSYYLDIDSRWKNSTGQMWSIERLVREELGQPIVGAACGGTHRLMGLAYAVRKRETSGRPMNGEFRRAQKYLDDYHRYTFTKLQNPDGSFSTEWFKAPGARPDLGRRIQTTGHILEWLSYSLPESELQSAKVVKAVEYLSGVLHDGMSQDWEVGPLGHALHALAIYDGRVFKPLDRQAEEEDNVAGGASDFTPDVVLSDSDTPSPRAKMRQQTTHTTRRPGTPPSARSNRPTAPRPHN